MPRCVFVCEEHTPFRFVSLQGREEKSSKFVKMFSLKIEACILGHRGQI